MAENMYRIKWFGKHKGLYRYAMLLMLMLTAMLISCNAYAGTVNLSYTVQYRQSEARTILDMINEMRATPADTWYWNEDNTARIQCGALQPLQYDQELEQMAMIRAAEIALSYSHTRPNATRCFTLHDELYIDVQAAAENIAAGYRTASSVNSGWREDDCDYANQGHRRAMLNGTYNAVGIACVSYNGYEYWVEEFAKKTVVRPGTAVDEIRDVSCNVAEDYINRLSVRLDTSTYYMNPGETCTIESAWTEMKIAGQFPSNSNRPIKANVSLSVDDTKTASLNGRTIHANAMGTAYITASYLGYTCQAAMINVHDCEQHYNSGEVSVWPSCMRTGTKQYRCMVCYKTKEETLPMLAHNWDDGVVTQEANCSVPGIRTFSCTNILCQATKTEYIPVNGVHTFGDWTATKEATVSKEGSKQHSCVRCGTTETGKIKKLKPTIKLSKKKITLKAGKTYKVKVTGLAKGDKIKSWSSNKRSVATVSQKGLIKGKRTGTAKITVKLKSGKKAVIKVTVR